MKKWQNYGLTLGFVSDYFLLGYSTPDIKSIYEVFKRILASKNMTPQQYEQAIRKYCKGQKI